MSEYYSHKSNKHYICINKEGEPVPDSAGNANGALLYHITVTSTRNLCPTFATNNFITCVVYQTTT